MPRSSLAIIVFAQFAGTSLWFAGNAVLAGQPQYSAAALTASVQVGFICGTLLFSLLAIADRWPATVVFLCCSLLGAMANALIPFFLEHVEGVLALRLASGFFLAGIYPVGMKIAAERFPQGLGKAMGWLVGALVLGTAFPHLLKGQLSQWSPALLFWAISILAASGGILLYLLVPASPKKNAPPVAFWGNIKKVWQEKPFRKPALGYLGHMWELYTFWAFVPFLLQSHSHFAAQNLQPGRFAFAIIAMGFVGCVLGGIMAAKKGSALVSRWAMLVSGACCLLLPLALQSSFTVYLLFLAIWGFAVVADSPQLSALAAQTAPPQLKGTALTLLTCAGFALTVVSLLFIQYLAAHLSQPHLALVALAPGPLFGAMALRKSPT
jgi:MFS family permease